MKENIRYRQFSQFFNYCPHNKNEFKVPPKIRVKPNGANYEIEI